MKKTTALFGGFNIGKTQLINHEYIKLEDMKRRKEKSMGIDLNDGFNELMRHKGHDVILTVYGEDNEPLNTAIECLTCMEVLIDFDKERN